jgi:hypothetical protein
MVAIESLDPVAIRGAKVFEASMFERMIAAKAPIVGAVMAVPMVITDVRGRTDVAALATFAFRLRARLAARRCENTGRARKRVRANGITKRDFILTSSEPMDVQKLTGLDRGLQVRRDVQVRGVHASCCFATR